MLSTKLTTNLNGAEKMLLYFVCNTATEQWGYQAPWEFIKILRPQVVHQRLEQYKQTIKPKFIPILTRLQKKLAAEI